MPAFGRLDAVLVGKCGGFSFESPFLYLQKYQAQSAHQDGVDITENGKVFFVG